MSAESTVRLLRAELERRFGTSVLPQPQSGRPGFRVGLRALDGLLPAGVPRGAVTLWAGSGTSGRTAALRLLVQNTVAAGTLVALVDASRTLHAADWSPEGLGENPGAAIWVARPPASGQAGEGAWVAEHLARTGAFGLLVLDGCLPAPTAAHRLRSLAREHDTAVVISVGADAAPAWRPDLRVEFRSVPHAPPGLDVGGQFRRVARVGIPKIGGGALIGEGEIEIVHKPPALLHPTAGRDRRSR